MDREIIEKKFCEFEKKEQKARAAYDSWADTRNRNRWENYRDLKEICIIALGAVDAEIKSFSDFRELEYKSIQSVINTVKANELLGKKTYTAEEVKALLWKTMY